MAGRRAPLWLLRCVVSVMDIMDVVDVVVCNRVFAEGRTMPKLKPHKGLLKRVKVTAKGKIIRHKANKGHLMVTKNGARRRRLGRTALVDKTVMKTMRRMLALQ